MLEVGGSALASTHHDTQLTVVTCNERRGIAARARASALAYAEIRLAAWAKWAKGSPERLGYPQLSMVYKVMRRRAKRLGVLHQLLDLRVKGLTARGVETRSLRPRSVGEVPAVIADVDRVVALLGQDHKPLIEIEYLGPEYPEEVKAAQVGLHVIDYRRRLKRAKLAVADSLK